MIYFLTIEGVKNICHDYARAHLNYNEPIPRFEDTDINQLESALFAPQREIGGKFVYPYLSEQGAVLFYEIIKLHPFLNGNKRLACITLLTFLFINGKWIKVEWEEFYKIAKEVAESSTSNREQVLKKVNKFIKENMIDSGSDL
jgi:death-on-curing family protein